MIRLGQTIEGPVTRIVPARKKISCFQCKYFDRSMTKSGYRPEYTSSCTNPKVRESGDQFERYPRIIDRYNGKADTPSWCPFLKDKAPENRS